MHSTVDRFRWFDGSLLMPGLKMQPFVCPRKKALHPRTLPRLADVKFQLRKFEQQTATPRPRYAERRERQLAEVSENSTKEGRKKEPNTSRTKGIVIQMSPTCFGRNTKFYDEAAAREAAAQYPRDKGYSVEASWCEACKAHHVRPVPLRVTRAGDNGIQPRGTASASAPTEVAVPTPPSSAA